jgi:ZIP family zinc transporter
MLSPQILALALGACLATLLGGFLMLRHHEIQHYGFAFAAGSLITVSLLDLLPESLELGQSLLIPSRTILVVLLASFFFYSLIDRVLLTHHLHEDAHGHPMGFVGAGSLILHSCLDGVAIGTAFRVSASVGMVVAAAVIIHDVNDGLNTVVVMLKHRHSQARARFFLILDALAPLLGVLLATVIAFPQGMLAYLLAFFAGEFLYLGAGSLLPEIHGKGSRKLMAAMFSGAALIAILSFLI